MEEGLELVPAVRPHGVDAKREGGDDVVEEGGVLLRVPAIDPQRANTRGVINRRVLVAPTRCPVGLAA
jgi:hypothetical protein